MQAEPNNDCSHVGIARLRNFDGVADRLASLADTPFVGNQTLGGAML